MQSLGGTPSPSLAFVAAPLPSTTPPPTCRLFCRAVRRPAQGGPGVLPGLRCGRSSFSGFVPCRLAGLGSGRAVPGSRALGLAPFVGRRFPGRRAAWGGGGLPPPPWPRSRRAPLSAVLGVCRVSLSSFAGCRSPGFAPVPVRPVVALPGRFGALVRCGSLAAAPFCPRLLPRGGRGWVRLFRSRGSVRGRLVRLGWVPFGRVPSLLCWGSGVVRLGAGRPARPRCGWPRALWPLWLGSWCLVARPLSLRPRPRWCGRCSWLASPVAGCGLFRALARGCWRCAVAPRWPAPSCCVAPGFSACPPWPLAAPWSCSRFSGSLRCRSWGRAWSRRCLAALSRRPLGARRSAPRFRAPGRPRPRRRRSFSPPPREVFNTPWSLKNCLAPSL